MSPAVHGAARRVQARRRRLLARRAVRESLVSLAGLVGRPVRNPAGAELGRLTDVVCRWADGDPYPPVAALVAKVGGRRVFVGADQVDDVGSDQVRLRSARLDLVDFERRPGEVLLAQDVLDHQLIDVDGRRVVRASDLYLAPVAGQFRLVGVDVGMGSLLRRLGPSRWQTRATPERVIDWATIASFGGRQGQALQGSSQGLRSLRPAELADLLEDLGRAERHELLDAVAPEVAADALEEMDAKELGSLLRESDPDDAADLLARMEPDEAAEALRHLQDEDRDELLGAMPTGTRDALSALLSHESGTAGALMTSIVVSVTATDTAASVRDRLRAEGVHDVDLDGVVVVDDEGRLVDDITFLELFLAEPDLPVGDLVGEPWPVTVAVDAPARSVIEGLIDSRRTSVVVLDEEGRPVGRILADDALDAVVGDRGRFRFPRVLG